METRASHLIIGFFVIGFTAAAFAFVFWLTKREVNQEFAYYRIYFNESVAGLGIGGDVRYRGIRAGAVTDIRIDPKDPSRVMVTAEIDKRFIIRQGDEAELQAQGITGLSYVNIGGAAADSPPLTPAKGEKLAVIPSRPSSLQKLFSGAPDLIASGIELTNRAADLLNEDNRRAIGNILADINRITDTMAAQRERIERLLVMAEKFGGDMNETVVALKDTARRANRLLDESAATMAVARGTLSGVDSVVDGELRTTLNEFSKAADRVGRLAEESTAMIAENREPLHAFAADGLPKFNSFIDEARVLVAALSRLTERLESDGARFLLGNRDAEYKAE